MFLLERLYPDREKPMCLGSGLLKQALVNRKRMIQAAGMQKSWVYHLVMTNIAMERSTILKR